MTEHQRKQREIVDNIEQQIASNTLNFSTIESVANFETDTRMCLTGVHLPNPYLLSVIEEQLIAPLRKTDPKQYYYSHESLHTTIKNIRTVKEIPDFTQTDIKKAVQVFSEVIPHHKKYNVYFYRLLLFPNNLALIGTTDEELDNIVLELDTALKKVGVPDDKQYINTKYFFSNITLARFTTPLDNTFRNKVYELSKSITIAPYIVDSVTLLTSNAVLKRRTVIDTWMLQ